MIYFSQLKQKKIVTEDGIDIGKLEDVIFLTADKPIITKWVIRTPLNKIIIIPNNYLIRLNKSIVFSKDYDISILEENELYLGKNLLDKQIIDLKGNKIVRVNDIAIQDRGEIYIVGVDVGILGILRRLRLEEFFYHLLNVFNIKISSQFLSWGDIRSLELHYDRIKMKYIDEKLNKIRPGNLVDYLEKTNIANIKRFTHIFDEKRSAEVISNLTLSYKSSLFENIQIERAAKILSFLSTDDVADILLTLSKRRRTEIMKLIPKEDKEHLNYLLEYPIARIGNIMTTEYVSVYPDYTIKEVINKIRKETSDYNLVNNIYVINQENQLIGVFDLHELLLEEDISTSVYRFMTHNVIFLYITTPVEVALRRMIKYGLLTMPVINKNNVIRGVVTAARVVASVFQ